MEWTFERQNTNCDALKASSAQRQDRAEADFLYGVLIGLAGVVTTEEWNRAIAKENETRSRAPRSSGREPNV